MSMRKAFSFSFHAQPIPEAGINQEIPTPYSQLSTFITLEPLPFSHSPLVCPQLGQAVVWSQQFLSQKSHYHIEIEFSTSQTVTQKYIFSQIIWRMGNLKPPVFETHSSAGDVSPVPSSFPCASLPAAPSMQDVLGESHLGCS